LINWRFSWTCQTNLNAIAQTAGFLKAKALAAALAQSKRFGKGTIMKLGRRGDRDIQVVSPARWP
jgi:hypothetical protein